eukprot:Gregarina_sp_Poly_1__7272@NODE_39_length_18147_cov_101_572069_g34_i0_p8_GENE_NODE_39_length_18147_cov_101_572069_g34_i0NODE_39_length_18147_cov_101_572069_g34_i0_p8_ORF_typecomplete_len304_score37_80_NODE_39_length_18147_cov_101_572069_g34_i055786489
MTNVSVLLTNGLIMDSISRDVDLKACNRWMEKGHTPEKMATQIQLISTPMKTQSERKTRLCNVDYVSKNCKLSTHCKNSSKSSKKCVAQKMGRRPSRLDRWALPPRGHGRAIIVSPGPSQQPLSPGLVSAAFLTSFVQPLAKSPGLASSRTLSGNSRYQDVTAIQQGVRKRSNVFSDVHQNHKKPMLGVCDTTVWLQPPKSHRQFPPSSPVGPKPTHKKSELEAHEGPAAESLTKTGEAVGEVLDHKLNRSYHIESENETEQTLAGRVVEHTLSGGIPSPSISPNSSLPSSLEESEKKRDSRN